MATNTQIKQSIDTNITNKTLPKSINNQLVGEDMKSIVDYVDQQDGLKANVSDLSTVATTNDYNDLDNIPTAQTQVTKEVKIVLSSSDLLSLKTNPILLVQGVAGKLLMPTFAHQKYNHVTSAYTANGNALIRFGTNINNSGSQFVLNITSASNSYSYSTLSISSSAINDFTGQSIYLTSTGSINPSGGDGTLEMYIVYNEITAI